MIHSPTKIVCTIGPACNTDDMIGKLIDAGMSVARLNFSHGTHEDHRQALDAIRRVCEHKGRYIAVIADLQGPKIRTGALENGGPVTLEPGARLTITTEECVGTAERVSTTYQALPEDVRTGDRILLDDGVLDLRVVQPSATDVLCEVVCGGPLGEHKGINLPGVKVSAPALTAKDRDDLNFALQCGVDYIALSFVRTAQDVLQAKWEIERHGADTPLIAKLEKPEAINELDAIVEAADAIMVARGDLGVEAPTEDVPILQKRIIEACSLHRKPVITATQMLDSMREHPRPTRTEASDVANAVLDGTDAVMLSGETAVGKYPVESVQMLDRIARAAWCERMRGTHLSTQFADAGHYLDFADAISRSSAQVAEELGITAIVAFTHSGSTARLASKCRPRVPILAASPLVETVRRCSLYWGVTPVLVDLVMDTDEMVGIIDGYVQQYEFAKPGDVIVITAGTPVGRRGTTNMMKLHVVGSK
jgi:pyruvate kinase